MISRHIPAEDERVNGHHKHSFVDSLVPKFCAGFIEGCYKSLDNPGVWDLTHWSQQGEVRCRKACRARPDRVRFAPFVRVRTTWNCRVADPIRKKIESLHGNYAAKCKTGLVACWWSKFDWSVFGMWVAPKSRVAWVNRVSWMKVPFQLPVLQFYEAARLGIRPGQFPRHFSQGPASTKGEAIPVLEIKPSDGRWWQTDEKDETTDIKWPLWQHLWHLLKRLWLLQDGLVSSHVPSLQKLHPLKQNRSSVDMEFFFNGSGSMVFIPFILRFLNMESTLLEWVALLLGSEDERKATQAGTVRAESTLPNPETRWNWIAINNHELNVMPWKRWAGFFFLPIRWRGRMKRVRAEQAGGPLPSGCPRRRMQRRTEVIPADTGAARKVFQSDDLGLTFYTSLVPKEKKIKNPGSLGWSERNVSFLC